MTNRFYTNIKWTLWALLANSFFIYLLVTSTYNTVFDQGFFIIMVSISFITLLIEFFKPSEDEFDRNTRFAFMAPGVNIVGLFILFFLYSFYFLGKSMIFIDTLIKSKLVR